MRVPAALSGSISVRTPAVGPTIALKSPELNTFRQIVSRRMPTGRTDRYNPLTLVPARTFFQTFHGDDPRIHTAGRLPGRVPFHRQLRRPASRASEDTE